ncbi:uncharacterized protein BO88DRAFT_44421 [Aspergillus vadensis CBS 113365]|uniref:Uncharacterized protein n=1 Tax=Aspergillus vadensis (strain CBS 113365 / IMI 142717 / IBT 24658) TaxID=1448311 RepID=A0A319BBD6_ASPVC|nr:hypothetical protein BO88DRAFT_44421 [Aspergillus vadensis CBS 113365]PYH69224.1 hypothetical protein BO88DRAFT_44421 [Aspergillus vadensis CBS 113365]
MYCMHNVCSLLAHPPFFLPFPFLFFPFLHFPSPSVFLHFTSSLFFSSSGHYCRLLLDSMDGCLGMTVFDLRRTKSIYWELCCPPQAVVAPCTCLSFKFFPPPSTPIAQLRRADTQVAIPGEDSTVLSLHPVRWLSSVAENSCLSPFL